MKYLILLLIPCFAKSQITPIVTTVNVGSGLVWTPKAGSTIEGTITAPSLATIQTTQTTQGATLSNHETRIKTVESNPPTGGGSMPAPLTVTGSSYKILQSDNGRTIFVSSTCTVTFPILQIPFKCQIVRTGAGYVTIATSGITLNSVNSYRKITRYGLAEIIYQTQGSAVLTGKLTY